jgi:peptidoglycan-associated lipoprotein
MSKMFKGFAAGLVLVLAFVAPACRSTKKTNPGTTTAGTSATVPDISATAPMPTPVQEPTDFVNPTVEPTTSATDLPSDVEQLNIMAQNRGFIRDAYFGYDESQLSADAQSALSASATWLKSNAGARYNLLVEGHCDERGTEQYNLALADRRASIVRDYLATLGVESSRIRTVSYGEERPFDEGHDESAWAKNRRAHLVLVAR